MSRTSAGRSREFQVLIAGGGVAGLEAALALRDLAGDFVGVELLAPEHHFFYRPLAVAEPFGVGRVHRWELDDLARAAGAEFTPDALERVDVQGHVAHTAHGLRIEYDAVVLACGARPQVAVPGALTFRGPADVDALRELMAAVARREADRIVFAVPSGTVWPLPLYEIALLAAAQLESSRSDASLEVVTSEPAPLALFGPQASEAVGALLDDHGIAVHTSTYAVELTGDGLTTVRGGTIAADRVVALPHLVGAGIEGVPSAGDGFVPTDPHGRVRGCSDVYAAGDLTTFPIKQGGLAAQQADAAAEAIAAAVGAGNEPQPFEPVLRALLLTGAAPAFLRVELGGGHGESSTASSEPLWWPPGKVVGRHLAPFLAELGVLALPDEPDEDALRIELESAAVHELGWPR
jgi:sulfide:quinone oxidoreductase